MNCKNTVFDFKRLIGRKFSDPEAQNELKRLLAKSREMPDGSIGIEVRSMLCCFCGAVLYCVLCAVY